MMVRLSTEAALRLREAVDREGAAPDDLASQAVAVWSQLSPAERRQTGLFGIGLVMQRLREGGDGGRQ